MSIGMVDSGSGGGGGGSLDADDDPWSDDGGSTDTSDDGGSTSDYDPKTSVDTGLTRATGDGDGGDVAANDPVNPSASSDTTDREAMTAEADEQQELIDSVQGDSADNSESDSDDDSAGDGSSNINKKAWAGVALVGAAVLMRGS